MRLSGRFLSSQAVLQLRRSLPGDNVMAKPFPGGLQRRCDEIRRDSIYQTTANTIPEQPQREVPLEQQHFLSSREPMRLSGRLRASHAVSQLRRSPPEDGFAVACPITAPCAPQSFPVVPAPGPSTPDRFADKMLQGCCTRLLARDSLS
jgi:hypothetical protein